jgi:integrase
MQPFREYRTLPDGRKLPYAKWRGRVARNGKREKVTLFTDKSVSERELRRLQTEADQEMQNPAGTRRRKHGQRPLSDHVAEYMTDLRRTTKNPEHHRISEWMLGRLVSVAGWQRLNDISQASMEAALKTLSSGEKPATVSYQNGFIKRAKAFCRWCVPDRLVENPLEKMKRGSTVRAKKNRARRSGTDAEIAALMAAVPKQYHLPLTFALLTGFRRSEQAAVTWNDLRLRATIPFIQLRAEWTKNEHADALPLHPVLVKMLDAIVATALRSTRPIDVSGRIFPSVPDVKTLKKYLEKASVPFVRDARRLDWHALRHTFSTNLDRCQCSWPTKKALLRHAQGEVTDGYSHARLSELLEAIKSLPSPIVMLRPVAIATGTDSVAIGGTDAGQATCGPVLGDAQQCTTANARNPQRIRSFTGENQSNCTPLHDSAWLALIAESNALILSETGPSTQVD